MADFADWLRWFLTGKKERPDPPREKSVGNPLMPELIQVPEHDIPFDPRTEGAPALPRHPGASDPSAVMSRADRPPAEELVQVPGIAKPRQGVAPPTPTRVAPPPPEAVRGRRRRGVQLVEFGPKSLDALVRATTPRRDFDQMPVHSVPSHLPKEIAAADLTPPWSQVRVGRLSVAAASRTTIMTVPDKTTRVLMFARGRESSASGGTLLIERFTGAVPPGLFDDLTQVGFNAETTFIDPESPIILPARWSIRVRNEGAAARRLSMVFYYVDIPDGERAVIGEPTL